MIQSRALPPTESPRLSRWLPYALACAALWGVWGVLAKITSGKMSPNDEQVLFTIGMLPVAVAAGFRLKGRVETDAAGVTYGILNGVCAGLGSLAYYAAMARAQASVVGAVTALFPLLTVVLAVAILRERINGIQAGGVVVALIAILLLST